MKHAIYPIFLATLWITASEFIRNELLFKNLWVEHFASKGLKFETTALNGILWMVWSFGLAVLMFKLLQKFSFKESLFMAWLPAFWMMWITVYNLQVLPLNLLIFAIPLSFFEIWLAGNILLKYKTKI